MLKGFLLSLKTQSHWVTSGFVIGSQQTAVCQRASDSFLKLKLSTQCIKSSFFVMFSAADRVIIPHLQKGLWLHDWFHYYVVQTFYIDKKKKNLWVFWCSSHFLSKLDECQKHAVCCPFPPLSLFLWLISIFLLYVLWKHAFLW